MENACSLLIGYGLNVAGSVRIENDEFLIDVSDHNLVREERCIYAYVAADEIVRIGSSKAPLSIRLGAWRRDVTNALQGRKSPTPKAESDGWRSVLSAGPGLILARVGTIVTTPVGEINAYLAEEAALIAKHRPRFCRR